MKTDTRKFLYTRNMPLTDRDVRSVKKNIRNLEEELRELLPIALQDEAIRKTLGKKYKSSNEKKVESLTSRLKGYYRQLLNDPRSEERLKTEAQRKQAKLSPPKILSKGSLTQQIRTTEKQLLDPYLLLQALRDEIVGTLFGYKKTKAEHNVADLKERLFLLYPKIIKNRYSTDIFTEIVRLNAKISEYKLQHPNINGLKDVILQNLWREVALLLKLKT